MDKKFKIIFINIILAVSFYFSTYKEIKELELSLEPYFNPLSIFIFFLLIEFIVKNLSTALNKIDESLKIEENKHNNKLEENKKKELDRAYLMNSTKKLFFYLL